MPLWTLVGLAKGAATTAWPAADGDDGQAGVLGMPRLHTERCTRECRICADICPTRAIKVPTAHGTPMVALDYGRCIACQLCVEACPTGAFEGSPDWAYGALDRTDLVNDVAAHSKREELKRRVETTFKGSLHIRHVDAGSCNGCESELQALNNPFYNLHRLGIFFTASPRFADLLLVTGPVTHAMHEPLRATWEAMPEPRMVMAMGTCAVSGGIAEGGYASGHGLDGVLPVDLWLPGCPPNPAAVIDGLLILVGRATQRVKRGRFHE
jgi:Ni,Fe-hydrogenase III small subunit/NAD-dependent dihydropyrimidine dehydrogenase PreA subunit